MQRIDRLLINICSKNLSKSKAFYTTLFSFNISYDSDWFISLVSVETKLEIGIIDKNHELVPKGYGGEPGGSYITIVVSDADKTYELAKSNGYTIIEEPKDTFYGQRRLLIQDPDGVLIDVSSPIPNFEF